MAKYALIVALKSVDPLVYNGFDGERGCEGAELDAKNIHAALLAKGFAEKNITFLLTENATRSAIAAELKKAALKCKRGDLFVFYFSGHGGQVLDEDGDERDELDETLVCYDGQISDDYLENSWKAFKRGARILVLSDCCNSDGGEIQKISKHSSLMKNTNADEMKASLIHIGASHEGTFALANANGGFFTRALCAVLNDGFSGTYQELRDAVHEKTRKVSLQQEIYREEGPKESNVFERFREGAVFADERRVEVVTDSGVSLFKPVQNDPPAPPPKIARKWFGCC